MAGICSRRTKGAKTRNLKNITSMSPRTVIRTTPSTNAVATNTICVLANKEDNKSHDTRIVVVIHNVKKTIMVFITNQILSATGTKGTSATDIVLATIIMNSVVSTNKRSLISAATTSVITISTSLVNTAGRNAMTILKTLTRSRAVVGHADRSHALPRRRQT